MNLKNVIFLFLGVAGLLSCGAAGVQNRFVPQDGFSEDPLDYTDVSRTLLSEQNYFVAYSQSSGRLAMIDADSYKEIWGTYTTKNVPYVFNLPGQEGAGLVSAGNFEVVIQEGSRKFLFPHGESASWSRAKSVIMLIGFDGNSKSVSIIKFRGENLWETATFQPFVGSTALGSESVVVAGRDGKSAVLLDPLTGSYVSFSELADKFSAGADCANTEALSDGPIKSVVIDESSGIAYAAIGSKVLQFAVGASSPCALPANWTLAFSAEAEIKRLSQLEDGRFTAILASGQIVVFSSSGGVLASERSISAPCTEPASVKTFGTFLAVTCVVRFTDRNKAVANAQLVVLDANDQNVFSRSIFFEKKSSVVFYPEKSQYIELFDSAAGEFDIHSVPSGSTTQLRGLFLGGILNRL